MAVSFHSLLFAQVQISTQFKIILYQWFNDEFLYGCEFLTKNLCKKLTKMFCFSICISQVVLLMQKVHSVKLCESHGSNLDF